MKERIEYYEERLYFLLRECENKESSERAMEKYKDKIETLIDEYRTFRTTQNKSIFTRHNRKYCFKKCQ
jgi:5'-deoxynucleotidase YfbR-like HD superfamily hydrolase